MVRALIVGIDPGITTGLAILDLSGNIIALISKREMSRNEMIKFITKFGQPLIVTSDVNPLPKSVEKIARELDAKTYLPEESLSISEKQELIKEFSDIVKDEHEVDALAASTKAWKSYRPFFSKIKDELQRHRLFEFFEDVAAKLLKGDYNNIEDAVKILKKTEEKKPEIENIQKLHRILSQKDKYIKALKRQINFLNKSLNETKRRLKAFEKRLYYEELDRQRKATEKLKKANELLKKIIEIGNRNLIPLVEVDKDFEEMNELIDLKDKLLFIDSLENLNFLNKYRIKGLLTTAEVDKKIIRDLEFPVVKVKEEVLQDVNGIKVIKPENLEKELKKAKKIGLVEWLEKYKKRKT